MEIKDQKSNPEMKESFFVRKVWLSPLFYIYFLSVLSALGYLYVNRLSMINRNSIQPDIAVDSAYNTPVKDLTAVKGGASEKIDLSTLLEPTKQQLARGEQLFKMDCAPCHGLDGKGDGPAAASLNPKPRDFHSTTGWINGRKLSQMLKTVSEGIPGSAMVSFAGSLPITDRLAVVDYIRTFSSDFPKDSPEELEALNKTYHLEKGEVTPSQIPVSEAMRQIEEEAIPRVKSTTTVMSYISQHSTDEGSRIFSSVTTDKKRALTMLAASGFWSKSRSDFVAMVTSDALQNGFDPKVAQLSVQDWQTLYGYLKGLFASKDVASSNG
ncbi:MAG: c-type cytochrome [Bacteroidetes bacterium]|nr:c-type cytochrome [Bacteroidota bacterium]MCL5737378.1 c-type cytochrome [Bacteroidota bacterium]